MAKHRNLRLVRPQRQPRGPSPWLWVAGVLILCAGLAIVPNLRKLPLAASSRSFAMGFTPFPWAATQEAVDWVHQEIRKSGDIVSEHFEEGIPWQEALEGKPFPDEFNEFSTDGSHTSGRATGFSFR